jgi:5-dehydro-4-deoxyglucarate dehydratase
MTSRDVRNRLKGVFGFPVTPFKKDLSLDLSALERNVGEMVKHPFCALVAAGGAGELYSLTPDEIEQVVRVTVQAAGGRMPVAAGTGYNAALGGEIARLVENAGADCVLALPPYYTNAPESGLFAYYEAIGRATGLPLMVYSRDWAVFSPQQVARLAERVPTLAGWKDGQGVARKYRRIMSEVGDRLAWFGGMGDDCAPEYFATGVQAYTSSISNIAPRVSLAIAEAGLAGDYAGLDALMKKFVDPLFALRERMKGYEVAVMKLAMEMLGMTAGPVRPPLCEVRPEDAERLRKIVEVYREA